WTFGGGFNGPSVPTQANSTGAQDPQIDISFDPITAADRSGFDHQNVAYFSRGVDAWYGANYMSAAYGGVGTDNIIDPGITNIVNSVAGGIVWYRFVRNGGKLTMSVSYDGFNYSIAMTPNLSLPSSTYNALALTGTT